MEEKQLVPKRRFKEFEGEWKEIDLDSIGSTFSGLSGKTKKDFGHGTAEFVTYMNIFNNTMADINNTEKVIHDNKETQLKYGDILFTTSSETPHEVGMSSVWLNNRPNVYLNSFCFGFRCNIKIDYYFIGYLLRANEFRRKIEILAQGISRYNISKSKVLELKINLPSIKEQQKIGAFFKVLDERIANQKRKIAKVKALKAAYLTEMFPQEGETVPKIRFKGFRADWGQSYLLDNVKKIIDFRGRTPKKLGLSWSEDGYLALSALNVKNGYIDYTVEPHYGDEELYYKWMFGNELKKNQVIFTTEAPMGNVAQVPDNKGYILSQRVIVFDCYEDKISNDFLAVLLRSNNINKKLTNLSSGGTAKGVSQKTLESLKVKAPCLEEQQKIGALFKNLDNQIVTEEKKLDKLKKMKEAYLEEMFV